MKKSYKIFALGLSSLLFFGCTSTPEVEYVRVTQFEALETKIAILEADKKMSEETYTALEDKFSNEKKGGNDEKIEIIEKSIENLQIDFSTIKEEFEQNKQLSAKQITDIDAALQSLEKIKDHYLDNALNADTLKQKKSSDTESTLKNSAPEKKGDENKKNDEKNDEKIIDLEAEAQKIRDSIKGEELEKLRVTFSEEKVSGEQTLFIFSKCENNICQKYLVEKTLFSDAVMIPSEKDSEFLISGTADFLGEISGENYFQVTKDFAFEEAKNIPKEGVSVFETEGNSNDNLSE